MRQTYLEAFKDIDHIQNHKQILEQAPISCQQQFLQVLVNISLYNHREPLENMQGLLSKYKGSFSHQILLLKYCTYCMEKNKAQIPNFFVILKLLTKWVDVFEQAKKKKDVRLYEAVVDCLDLGACTYEEFIVYLNFISNDLVSLIKSGTEETKRKYDDLTKFPYLDPNDLLRFLNVILPKVLTNMIIPRNFFPPTLLKTSGGEVDILYSFQTVQNIAQNKTHYNILVRNLIKTLLSFELEPSQLKQLVLNSFKYYYLYHHDKSYSASQFVIESFKKMTSAVRFAILDQIVLFFVILKKLGKQLFISYLADKFWWVNDAIKTNTAIIGLNKAMFKPFFNMSFGNSLKIKVDAGKTEHYFMEIYDVFSLAYFCVRCAEHDITIRLYYMGKFNQQEARAEKKLLVCAEKKEGLFQGSIETIEEGIYMFEFDNSYAWMKAKHITFDLAILVPIEIREHSKNKIKSLIFQRIEHLNEVPFENVVGWVEENEIKVSSTSVNVSCFEEGGVKTFNLKSVKNTGQIYQYETESKFRLLKRIHAMQNDSHLFWLIDGYKIKGPSQVEKWLEGDFQPDRFPIHHTLESGRAQNEEDDQIQQTHREQSQVQLITGKDLDKKLQLSFPEKQASQIPEIQASEGVAVMATTDQKQSEESDHRALSEVEGEGGEQVKAQQNNAEEPSL